jgi:D-alanyl-D-alanine carboxypeptidase
MTLLLKRCVAGLCWLAACNFVFVTWAPSQAFAQSRAAPPTAKYHAARAAQRAASAWVPNPAVTSKDSYLIVDATSGRELAADRADELRHPASLTKLMTLYLTFSALDSGQLSLADSLPVSLAALNASPTKMGLIGGSVLVRDAVMGLVTRSANDAAIVLGEALGGDEENFARLMTQKARQLGMTSTVYRNASGLPNREQVTTARDLAKLAHALLRDFPHYYPIFSVQSYIYRGRPLANHNQMLQTYAGADGMKTGYTSASGFNLVLSAVRDNRRLIGVVMGGGSGYARDRLMAELMDRGFAQAQALNLSAWTSPRIPSSARYSAANFVPGAGFPDAPRVGQVVKAEPAPSTPKGAAAPAPIQLATTSHNAPIGGAEAPTIGSWVIQVGSFNDSQAAEQALQRATSVLPETIRSHGSATIDEVQMAQRTFHRARLTNLSQTEAVDGCKKLSQRKIYCAALQVTAWNTPGAH